MGVDFIDDAQKVLDVMTNFVADHVRVRELPWRSELPGHHIKEGEVQVDDAVLRTVERASGTKPTSIDAILRTLVTA